MQIVVETIKLDEVRRLAKLRFGNLVKGVVDINRKIICLDAELHADEEAELLQNGSKQKDLWGINLYPEKFGTEDFIEFDSMINLRPSQKNFSRGVEDKKIQRQIKEIISGKIVK